MLNVFNFERFQCLIVKGFCWDMLCTATECLPERDIYWYTTYTGNGGLLAWDVYWYRVFTGKPCLMVRDVCYYGISIGTGVSTCTRYLQVQSLYWYIISTRTGSLLVCGLIIAKKKKKEEENKCQYRKILVNKSRLFYYILKVFDCERF